MESDFDSSSSDSDDGSTEARKKARRERREEKMHKMIAAAVQREVARGRNGNEDIIAQVVRDEVAKSAENAPNLPKGNDLVTIDEHLSDELIADIVNDKYVDLNKVSSV